MLYRTPNVLESRDGLIYNVIPSIHSFKIWRHCCSFMLMASCGSFSKAAIL